VSRLGTYRAREASHDVQGKGVGGGGFDDAVHIRRRRGSPVTLCEQLAAPRNVIARDQTPRRAAGAACSEPRSSTGDVHASR
jgi:hypothetical protein